MGILRRLALRQARVGQCACCKKMFPEYELEGMFRLADHASWKLLCNECRHEINRIIEYKLELYKDNEKLINTMRDAKRRDFERQAEEQKRTVPLSGLGKELKHCNQDPPSTAE